MTRHRSLVVALAAALIAGCSESGSGGAAPVDAPKAREALKSALDGWKRGQAPASFAKASPAMTVQDMDWMTGAKLVDYQFDDDGKEVGANLHVPVSLTMKTQGREVKKKVNYIVGTSPILTVFRALR